MRITAAQLESLVNRLNEMTGNPIVSWVKDESGKFRAQIGNYHLDGAYGGWALYQMQSDGGGIRDVLHVGHCSKKELYTAIHAYIAGIEECIDQEAKLFILNQTKEGRKPEEIMDLVCDGELLGILGMKQSTAEEIYNICKDKVSRK